MTRKGCRVVDSDLHVMEGPRVWVDYADPAWRDRMPQVVDRRWVLDGRPFPARTDDPKRAPGWARRLAVAAGDERFEDARASRYDAASTLRAMDTEGVDVAVLFRTIAGWFVSVDGMDPALSAAVARAFNRWLADYASDDPARLLWCAQLPLHDTDAAVAEARFAVEDLGARAVVIPSNPTEGRPLYDPTYDKLWAYLADAGVPLTIHGTHSAYQEHIGGRFIDNLALAHAVSHPFELALCVGAMTLGGVLHRYPGLRVAFLEGNCGWLPWWLWRLDEEWEKLGHTAEHPVPEPPSSYFRRSCVISADPDEPALDRVVEAVGADSIVLSTDYPHDDSLYPHAIDTFLEVNAKNLDESTIAKVLGGNCDRFYGLER